MINSRISSTNNLMKTIRSKYDGSYSYDDKKVEIKKDEVFILIKKASQDWYLCIRINEPDKPFFVPSTYVEELSDTDVNGNLTPTTTRNSSSKDSNNTIIPSYYHSQDEQTDNNNDNESIVAAGVNNNNNKNEIFNVNSKKLNGGRNILINHDSSSLLAADDVDYDSPDYVNAIISDLDERLNLEYNDDVETPQQVPPKVKERKFINKMNLVETTTNEADIECVKTPEPDYDNIDYENAVQTRNRMQKLSSGSSEGRSTRKTVPIPPEPDYSDEDELHDHDEDNDDDDIDVNANDDGECDNLTVGEEDDDDGEEDDDDEDDDDEEENTRLTSLTVTHNDAVEQQQQEVVFRDRKTTTTTTTATNTDKRLLDANVVIPEGWQQSIDVYQRSLFTNPITKEKWFLAFNSDGKAYFYDDKQNSLWHLPEINNNDQNNNNNNSKTNNEGTHFSKKIDDGLTTFNHLHKRVSEVISKPSDEFASSQTPQISYTYKTKNILTDKFKIVQLLENGKKCKSKKNSEHYRIDLASSKLLFIKESTKQHSKLDFHLDFKGGSCYKLNIKDKNHQRIADGLKGFSKTDLKNTFVVETLNGSTVAFTHENPVIIDEWVSAINSMIKQIQSEFSPIYEEPGSLHCVKLENDKYFNPNLNHPTTTASTTTTNSNKKGGDKDESVTCTYNSDDNELADNYNNESDDNDSPIDDINSNFGSTMQLLQKQKEEKNKIKNVKKDKNKSDNNNKKQKSPKNSKKKESTEIQVQYHKSLSTSENERAPSTAEIKINKKSTDSATAASNNNINAATNTVTSSAFKAKLKEYLIAFFKRRPSLEYLKQKNIIQECIFGGSLMNICLKERRSVPTFVDEIIKAIEKKGLDMDGIYRISGNLAEVQKLRIQVNQGKFNFSDCDIHVLTGALKTFFRELEDPLVPVAMQEGFLNAIKNKDKTKKFQQIKELISNMPLPHRDTTHRLFSHLLKVIELRSVNRMHLQNIALVFGPTLLRINPLNATNNGFSENIILQNDLVEYILMHFIELFDATH